MFDSTDDPNPPPTAEESYATSAGASNLRVEADRRTPADMVIAAGMNQHRLGLALMRLMTEWDASAKPVPMTAKRIEELSRTYPKQANGLVLAKGRDGKDEEVLPLVLAQREAAQWHSHELGLLLQRMKSLPFVRDGMLVEARSHGWEEPERIVASVLQWWLHKVCPVCNGSKFKVVAGTGRTGSKACSKCKGSGDRTPPHGWQGRKLLTYINVCRVAAIQGLQGKFRHQKPK
jgi:hypothetical protein